MRRVERYGVERHKTDRLELLLLYFREISRLQRSMLWLKSAEDVPAARVRAAVNAGDSTKLPLESAASSGLKELAHESP